MQSNVFQWIDLARRGNNKFLRGQSDKSVEKKRRTSRVKGAVGTQDTSEYYDEITKQQKR